MFVTVLLHCALVISLLLLLLSLLFGSANHGCVSWGHLMFGGLKPWTCCEQCDLRICVAVPVAHDGLYCLINFCEQFELCTAWTLVYCVEVQQYHCTAADCLQHLAVETAQVLHPQLICCQVFSFLVPQWGVSTRSVLAHLDRCRTCT